VRNNRCLNTLQVGPDSASDNTAKVELHRTECVRWAGNTGRDWRVSPHVNEHDRYVTCR
jgi:hypothetical protein